MQMKYLALLATLVFSVMFSSASFAEWTKLVGSVKGNTFYVDFERIKIHDGYVYYWELLDFLKPSPQGDLSGKMYNQGDCKLFRYKMLSGSFHKEPMGRGTGAIDSYKNPEWIYPPPKSSIEGVLKAVCDHVK